MAMSRRREVQPPNGALIIWMAGLVLGAGAGIVLVYHMLLASHAVSSHPLHAAQAAPAKVLAAPAPASAPVKGTLSAEHQQALQAAMKGRG